MTSEQDLLDRIQQLVEEEKSLHARRGDGQLSDLDEGERLNAVAIQIDQCWDLLRQRRALQEAGRSPDQAQVRPAGEVEGYLSCRAPRRPVRISAPASASGRVLRSVLGPCGVAGRGSPPADAAARRRGGEPSPVHDHHCLQVTVEAPIPSVRLIRVAGRLDRAAAASVLRLISVQLDLIAGRHHAVTDLVLDIEQVHSFEPGGLESLRHAPYTAGQRGIGVYLSGCGGRVAQLPLRTRQLLSGFRTFPTTEVALEMLTTTRPADPTEPLSSFAGPGSRPAAADPTSRPDPATDTTADHRLPDRMADFGRGRPRAVPTARG